MKPLFQDRRIRILVICLLVLVPVIAYFARGTEDIDVAEEGAAANYSVQARIVDGQELVEGLGGVTTLDNLSKDLFVFAKTAYREYRDFPDKVVGFKIASDIKKDGDKLKFDGHYGSVKRKILVEVTVLKNSRLKTSITDDKTKLSIDAELPSNTRRNQFIGTLPIETADYTINYQAVDDSFFVNILNSPNNYSKAAAAIVESLGLNSIEDEQVTFYGAGTNISPYW